ncbi:IS30 family transposase [Streptobacillus moniliformis]|uniref:IS30 family transposase n=1 Tax=Streptobacillus moniliformis TaxID=34105 RepID=UPI0012DAF0E7
MSHILSYLQKEYNEKISKKTIYNWIEKGLLKYDKKKIKKVKVKGYESKQTYQMLSRKKLLEGKEYEDFLNYVFKNKNFTICELDLVQGSRDSGINYLLTFFIPKIQFLFAFKIKNKEPQSVVKVLDWLERRIGHKYFKRLFGLLLSDQGSEFLKYKKISRSVYGSYTKRCEIFYCKPASPYQKPNIENIHTLLRRFIPKGTDIENYSQNDINYIVSNLNSLYKVKYNNKSPIKMFL